MEETREGRRRGGSGREKRKGVGVGERRGL
jgi:hypothetical protein